MALVSSNRVPSGLSFSLPNLTLPDPTHNHSNTVAVETLHNLTYDCVYMLEEFSCTMEENSYMMEQFVWLLHLPGSPSATLSGQRTYFIQTKNITVTRAAESGQTFLEQIHPFSNVRVLFLNFDFH